jgi:hemolysin D
MQFDGLALRGLLNRYLEVLRHAWKIRRELDTPARQSYEAEFLPAHLEITDTPVHPAPRWTMRAIGALVAVVAGVAFFGHLDIVAVAHGKLVPNARVKIIQPAVTGVVRSILVQNGMHVAAGQLLLELDPAQAAADTDKASASKMDAELAAARAQALLHAQANNKAPSVESIPAATPERRLQIQAYAVGVYNEYWNKLASLRAQLDQRQAELGTARDEIKRLQATAPIARQQANDFKSLTDKHYVSKYDYLEKERNALKEEGDLRTDTDRAIELSAAVEEQKQEIATTVATFRREQLEDLEKAQQALAQSTNDQAKARVRESLMSLTAPVAGTVQNLAVHTVGGVVTTAQSLLEIVPEDTLEVEASVDNKDIGFVEAGQDAIIKIDAFSYTRFGYLQGKVFSVSNDAVENKASGLQYLVRVGLPTNQMVVGNKKLNLTPGMQVVAEIRTGRRTVAEYFFSPLVETFGQSMRER